MKAFVVTLVLIAAFCIGGYFGYTRFLQPRMAEQSTENPAPQKKVGSTTEEGVLIKLPNPTDDYTHNLKTATGLVKVASYSVKLDEYNGKTVKITGQYSGDTLFADSVTGE